MSVDKTLLDATASKATGTRSKAPKVWEDYTKLIADTPQRRRKFSESGHFAEARRPYRDERDDAALISISIGWTQRDHD